MSTTLTLSPIDKARIINHDPYKYGTFAEIGAGQEVARNFFRSGKASSTIAKTMSAYDMIFSDSIYGPEPGKRYVCESRLKKMLDHEFDLIRERIWNSRDPKTHFFVFADTVASKRNITGLDGGHGWLGVRFQSKAETEPSEVIIHVNLLDKYTLDQQEAVGTVGVNLIYACFYLNNDPEKLIDSLKDSLKDGQIEIDMIRCKGPAFKNVDNRLMSLRLVEQGLTNVVLFSPKGESLQPSEVLYKKHVLIQRGRFKPVTKLHVEMLESAKTAFTKDCKINESECMSIMEITLTNLLSDGRVNIHDCIAQIEVLGSLNQYIMISNYPEYYRLSEFLSKYTRENVAIVMGIAHLDRIFDEKYYTEVPGGIVAALGNLFRKNVKAYIYPAYSLSTEKPAPAYEKSRSLHTCMNYLPPENLKNLYAHFMSNKYIRDLPVIRTESLEINSEDVLKMIQSGNPEFMKFVPEAAAKIIQEKSYFKD
jgi:hypothetical protein